METFISMETLKGGQGKEHREIGCHLLSPFPFKCHQIMVVRGNPFAFLLLLLLVLVPVLQHLCSTN